MLRPAILIACTLTAAPALAEPLSPVKTAELSARLFDAGVQSSDPLLILAAAKLRKTLNPASTYRIAEAGTATSDTPLGWKDMLHAATPLASGDGTLLGLIDDIRAETTNGVATGPGL